MRTFLSSTYRSCFYRLVLSELILFIFRDFRWRSFVFLVLMLMLNNSHPTNLLSWWMPSFQFGIFFHYSAWKMWIKQLGDGSLIVQWRLRGLSCLTLREKRENFNLVGWSSGNAYEIIFFRLDVFSRLDTEIRHLLLKRAQNSHYMQIKVFVLYNVSKSIRWLLFQKRHL